MSTETKKKGGLSYNFTGSTCVIRCQESVRPRKTDARQQGVKVRGLFNDEGVIHRGRRRTRRKAPSSIRIIFRNTKTNSSCHPWSSIFLTSVTDVFNLGKQRLPTGARILVLGTQRTQRISGNGFRISFHPDRQVDNGFLTSQS